MMTDTASPKFAGAPASYLPANGGAVALGALGAPIRSIGANRRLEPTVAA